MSRRDRSGGDGEGADEGASSLSRRDCLASMLSIAGAAAIGGVEGCGGDEVAPPPAEGIYLRGATIIPATGDPPLSGHAVHVVGDKIHAVEPARASLPAPVEVIDLDGHYLLPGFVECHVHVGTTDGATQEPLDMHLDYGVTSLKDVCAPQQRILKLREDVASGVLVGPRVFAVGAAFTAPGGHPAGTLFAGNAELIAAATREVDDPGAAREEVAKHAAAGVDQIKCMITDWFGSVPRLAPAVLKAIVEEAHGSSLRVVVHTDTPQDVRDVIDAGADGIEHGVTSGAVIDDALAKALADAGLFFVPTAGLVAMYQTTDRAHVVASIRNARERGVKIAVGTDANNGAATWGASFHHELTYLVDAGFSTMDALISATRVGAEHVDRAAELGTIEGGKLADLIALPRDPLQDVFEAHDVRFVMRGGEVVRDKLGEPPP